MELCPWQKRVGKIRDFPEYGVDECQKCLLVSHRKDLRQGVDYENGSMHNWAAGYGGTLIDPVEDFTRRASQVLKLSKKFKIKSILDFGSGSGEMIKALSPNFSVVGLEPEKSVRESCISQGMQIYESSTEALQARKKFDLVTLFHVVEHFYKPEAELSQIYELVRPGGLLLIETPNSQDALLTTYKSRSFSEFTYWSHHPMLHSNRSLGSLVGRSKFDLIINSGIQRFSLENHLYWLIENKPGGHVAWEGMFSPDTNRNYERDLVSEERADTIWLVAQKPNE